MNMKKTIEINGNSVEINQANLKEPVKVTDSSNKILQQIKETKIKKE